MDDMDDMDMKLPRGQDFLDIWNRVEELHPGWTATTLKTIQLNRQAQQLRDSLSFHRSTHIRSSLLSQHHTRLSRARELMLSFIWAYLFEKPTALTRPQDAELSRHCALMLLNDSPWPSVPYSYSALPTPTSFRLIALCPGDLDEPVQILLLSVEPEDVEHAYQALSYAWGNTEDRLPVSCNHQLALVTVSAYSALLRLRKGSEHVWLWLDSLCINQASDAAALRERGLQVQRMRDIYTSASQVIVDLGGADESFSVLLELFKLFAQISEEELMLGMSQGKVLPELESLTPDHPIFGVYEQFMRRPYFRRIWVVQEFVLARDIRMCVGKYVIDWDRLDKTLMKVWLHLVTSFGAEALPSYTPTNTSTLDILSASFSAFRVMQVWREQREQGRVSPPFEELVDRSLRLLATDNRDRIYALLGLATDIDPAELPVDYAEQENELSLRVSKLIIQRGRGAFLLCRASGSRLSPISWTLDIANGFRTFTLEETVDAKGHSSFYAAGGPYMERVNFRLQDQTIIAQGCIVCNIVSVSKSWDMVDEKDAAEWTMRLRSQYQWAMGLRSDSSDTTFKAELCRSMSLDCYTSERGQHRIGSDSVPCIRAWEQWMWVTEPSLPADQASRAATLDHESRHSLTKFVGTAMRAHSLRKLALTSHGSLAVVPVDAEVGDQACIMLGIPVPFVLREDESMYRVIGACYIYTMMDGEALRSPRWKEQDIMLI